MVKLGGFCPAFPRHAVASHDGALRGSWADGIFKAGH